MAYTDRQWNSVSKQCDSQNSLNSSQFPDGLLEYWFQPTVILVPVNSISGTQVSAFPPLLSTAIAEIIQEPINVQRNEKEGQGYSPSPKRSSPASAKGQGWAENHRNSRGWIYFSQNMEACRAMAESFSWSPFLMKIICYFRACFAQNHSFANLSRQD